VGPRLFVQATGHRYVAIETRHRRLEAHPGETSITTHYGDLHGKATRSALCSRKIGVDYYFFDISTRRCRPWRTVYRERSVGSITNTSDLPSDES